MTSASEASESAAAQAAKQHSVRVDESAGSRQLLALLGVTSGVIVATEVLMTRLLSVVTWYGLAFFVLSIAMLGLTAGSLEALSSQKAGVPLREFVASRSLRLSGALMFALVATLIIPMPTDSSLTLQLAVIAVAAAQMIPMTVGGSIVARIMAESKSPIGTVYAIDLGAAALGALCPLLLLGPFDGVTALIVLAALPALAGGLIEPGAARKRMFGFALFLGLFAAMNNYSQHGLTIRFAKHHFADPFVGPAFDGWNALSNVQARPFAPMDRDLVLWGPSPSMPPGRERVSHASIDGEAGTLIHSYKKLEELEVLKYDVTNAVHWIRPTGPACVVGVGGARDIESALLFGHESVFAAEINPLMVDMLRKTASESPILSDPRIHIEIGDGRSVLSSRAPYCNVLQVSLVDTWAATGAGAYTHSEATLYTREAWQQLLKRVEPNGVLTFSRWYSPDRTSETSRLMALAVASLLERGVKKPEDHIALITHTPRADEKKPIAIRMGLATILVSTAPFSPGDVATIKSRAKELQFDVLLAPGVQPPDAVLQRILATREIDRLADAGRDDYLDTTAPTDNRPFFFQVLRASAWINPAIMLGAMVGGGVIYGNVLSTIQMLITFGTVIFLAVFVLGPPLRRARREGGALPDGGAIVYFAMLGAGFMLVELALMQRLHVVLGHPTYSLVVVLSSLLVCTGIGSTLSSSLITTRRAATVAALVAAGLLLVVPFVIEPLAQATVSSSLAVRIAWTASLTGTIGLVLGTLFPSGIRFVERDKGLPVALGVNGATSVIGSILSVIVSVVLGIAASLTVAAVLYLIAAACGPWRWKDVA